jgi:glycosyltransferase involved in cell wall biosynthesis
VRIAVNGLAIRADETGVGRTTRNLVRALVRRCPTDEVIVFLPADAPRHPGLEAPNLRLVSTRITLKTPLDKLYREGPASPEAADAGAVDVVYSPSFLLPDLSLEGAPRVATIHDLSWDLLPKTRALLFRSYMHRRLDEAVRDARRLVCVSQATAEDLQALRKKVPRERLCIVHHGVDREVFRPEPDVKDPGPPFLVVVSNQDPRARIRSLADAFPRVRARMRPCRLVPVGAAGPSRQTPPTVDFVGPMGEREIASLYRRALMVVQPSAYEGFGLPTLEAMACGTAVACADTPLFRELAGTCARYFDPANAASIAAAMEDLARGPSPREELVKEGLERAARFGWDATATRLREIFAEVAP